MLFASHTGWKNNIPVLYFVVVHKSTPSKIQNRNIVFQTVHYGNITLFQMNYFATYNLRTDGDKWSLYGLKIPSLFRFILCCNNTSDT